MSRRRWLLWVPGLLVLLLAPVQSDAQWGGAAAFESEVSCETSIADVRAIAKAHKMRVREIPYGEAAEDGTKSHLVIMLFKGNTSYSMLYAHEQLENIQKQQFRAWRPFPIIKRTESIEKLLDCTATE